MFLWIVYLCFGDDGIWWIGLDGVFVLCELFGFF